MGRCKDSGFRPNLTTANGLHLAYFHKNWDGICNGTGGRKESALVVAIHSHTRAQKIKSTKQLSFNRNKTGFLFCFFFFFFPVWMLITEPYRRDNERVLLPSISQTKTWKIHEQRRPWCWAPVFLSNISALEVLRKVTQQYSSLKDACQPDLKATRIL